MVRPAVPVLGEGLRLKLFFSFFLVQRRVFSDVLLSRLVPDNTKYIDMR
jgi:hypothetical protein